MMPAMETADWEEVFDAGLTALMRGQLTEAAEQFQQVLAVRPHYGPAYLQLGRCEWRRGDVHKALEIMRAGLKVAGNSANLRAEVGFAFLVLGDMRKAVVALTGAQRLSRKNIRALQGLAWLYVEEEAWGKALSALHELQAVSGANFAAHYLMARVQDQLHNSEEAQREWFQAEGVCREKIKHADGQAAAQYFLGEILHALQGWDAGREHYEAAADMVTADEPYLFGMGLVVPATKVLEQAAAACAACGDKPRALHWTEKLRAFSDEAAP